MAFGRGAEFVVRNSKKISLFILLIAAVFSAFTVSREVTGLTTRVDQISGNLGEVQDSANFIRQERESCYSDLSYAQGSFNSCQEGLNKTEGLLNLCKNDFGELRKSYDSCSEQKGAAEKLLEETLAAYEDLAKNSVTAICCSFSDVRSGEVKSWGISNNTIACSGNFTVNCKSGEISR